MSGTIEKATLGGGCFWCLEAVFENLPGVVSVLPGYAGGHVASPVYAEVCEGRTGHAEVVELSFDPAQIAYREILEVFFSIHDPTTPNRQGHDVGTQYRSVIFCHGRQQLSAEELIGELERGEAFPAPIVTEVLPAPTFYPAEEVHRQYFRRNPGQGYCQAVIAPKLAKFRAKFRGRLNLR